MSNNVVNILKFWAIIYAAYALAFHSASGNVPLHNEGLMQQRNKLNQIGGIVL